jgi:hypothetical protein
MIFNYFLENCVIYFFIDCYFGSAIVCIKQLKSLVTLLYVETGFVEPVPANFLKSNPQTGCCLNFHFQKIPFCPIKVNTYIYHMKLCHRKRSLHTHKITFKSFGLPNCQYLVFASQSVTFANAHDDASSNGPMVGPKPDRLRDCAYLL